MFLYFAYNYADKFIEKKSQIAEKKINHGPQLKIDQNKESTFKIIIDEFVKYAYKTLEKKDKVPSELHLKAK